MKGLEIGIDWNGDNWPNDVGLFYTPKKLNVQHAFYVSISPLECKQAKSYMKLLIHKTFLSGCFYC